MSGFAVQPELPFEEFVAEKDDNRRLEWVLATLPDGPLLRYLREPREGRRNEYPVEVLWRCVVAKFVYQIKTYAELIRELWRNGSLRRLVGLEGSIPRDYHFSRLLKQLSSPVGRRLLQAMFAELVRRIGAVEAGLGEYVAVDGTAVHAYSNAKKARRGQGSDPDAKWGTRTKWERPPTAASAQVEKREEHWFGYVVELLVDCESELPLGYAVNPANAAETLQLRPLLEAYQATHPQLAERAQAVIADKGYDSRENCAHVLRELEALAIIKLRRRLAGDAIDQSAACCCTELGTPICPSGHPMKYWGRDGHVLKWRCPAKVGKHPPTCTFRGGCGTPSAYGRTVKISCWEDPRRWPGVWRESRTFEKLYRKRTAAERVNSRLKQHLLLDDLTIRGIGKVEVHVALGLTVMLAGATAMIEQGRSERMRRTVRLAS
ncbi:MAG: transposase [Armatimonadetes bacterium]|nr:transposase [Armatimonadota bacterium]